VENELHSITGKSNKTGIRTKRKNRLLIRKVLSLVGLTTFATVSLTAEPTPSADRPPSKNAKKVESQKPEAKPNATARIVPALPLTEGWSYVKGEWIHSDGYKYLNGRVIRTDARTHKAPPKPPSKALLRSVTAMPASTPDPNSAAAKAAAKERNTQPRPAPQTGTHL
jgi:hypothetical protein